MRKQLTVNLGEQHEAWLAYAKSCGIKPSTLAALVLKELLRQNGLDDVPEVEPTTAKRGIYIRLNADEMAFLDEYALKMKRTRQKAVIAVIRNAIASEPQFSLDEEITLKDSNRELARIGVNLNQITRKLNSLNMIQCTYQDNKLLLKRVMEGTDKLSKQIKKHVSLVWDVINAGRYRMALKDKK